MRQYIIILVPIFALWPLVYFGLPALGYFLANWVYLLAATISVLMAGAIVLMGESIIEDGVKLMMFAVLSGVLWMMDPRLGFVFVSIMPACVIGTLLNQLNRSLFQRR